MSLNREMLRSPHRIVQDMYTVDRMNHSGEKRAQPERNYIDTLGHEGLHMFDSYNGISNTPGFAELFNDLNNPINVASRKLFAYRNQPGLPHSYTGPLDLGVRMSNLPETMRRFYTDPRTGEQVLRP